MGMITKADYVEIKRAYAAWEKAKVGKKVISVWGSRLFNAEYISNIQFNGFNNPLMLPKQFVLKEEKCRVGMVALYALKPEFLYFLTENTKFISKFYGQFIHGRNYSVEDYHQLEYLLSTDVCLGSLTLNTVYIENRYLVMRCSASDLPD